LHTEWDEEEARERERAQSDRMMAYQWTLAQDFIQWLEGVKSDRARAILRGDDMTPQEVTDEDEMDLPDEQEFLMVDPIWHITPPNIMAQMQQQKNGTH
jgi:hypothetical protein